MGSRQGVEPAASLFAPKELLAVTKRPHCQRSGGVEETSLKFWQHPALPSEEQPLPRHRHRYYLVLAERVKPELVVAICAPLNADPSRAGLSPVVVDLIDSDGHSTGSGQQAVPSLPCCWARAEDGGCGLAEWGWLLTAAQRWQLEVF